MLKKFLVLDSLRQFLEAKVNVYVVSRVIFCFIHVSFYCKTYFFINTNINLYEEQCIHQPIFGHDVLDGFDLHLVSLYK